MPATAGRVRMPANNRVHSSAALQTHGIWQSAIGYDPYAPNKVDNKSSEQKSTDSGPEAENAYASFQGLLALARITGSNADEPRGACKKCGRVGHLTYQCRNFLSVKDYNSNNKDKDSDAVLSGLDKLKGKGGVINKSRTASEESSEEEEEESESSDSDYDSEIERIIADKYRKKDSSKLKSSRRKEDDSKDDDDLDSRKGKKRDRSKKRGSERKADTGSDSMDEGGRKRRKEKRRRDDSSDEEDERRHRRRKSRKEKRSRHWHSDDSGASEESASRRKQKSRRATSTSDSEVSREDYRVGRERKHSEKRSRKHRHEKEAH